jgi:hypothetical protein
MVPKLTGSFPLNQNSITQNIKKNCPGVYVLGTVNANLLPVQRSGRSDDCLASRLAAHIGKYSDFMFAYCPTREAAFYAECELHHEYKPSDNILHPDRPNGTNLKCPRCTVFG